MVFEASAERRAAEDPDVGRARAHLSSDGNEGLIPGWAITRLVRPLLGFRPEIECGPDQASGSRSSNAFCTPFSQGAAKSSPVANNAISARSESINESLP